ncbi:MAG TPA: DUF1573 domain-containing protein [Flavipsychrobacter sp.]|nr:DUF1573 domain-containing protein [Flavipsychrobacter sp.]
MKKYLLFTIVAAALFTACKEEKPKEEARDKNLLPTDLVNNPRSANGGNPEELAAMPTMDFKDTVFDFGTIKEGDVSVHEFEFTNNGKNPLIISNATGSCGCTIPEYPSEPVVAGKSNKIKVEFNSKGKPGHQEKSVAVTTNSRRGVHMLYIKGNVK